MATQTTNSEHHLTGDWTITGVVNQLDTLRSTLRKFEHSQKKRLHIDCGKIEAIDLSGLQLIHVWLELVKMHGMEAQLFNLPHHMHYDIRRLGLGQCFTDNPSDVA